MSMIPNEYQRGYNEAMAEAMSSDTPDGFVIADGTRRRFRTWGMSGPEWTDDIDAALWFSRQGDAEKVAAEDEDAWYIVLASVLRKQS